MIELGNALDFLLLTSFSNSSYLSTGTVGPKLYKLDFVLIQLQYRKETLSLFLLSIWWLHDGNQTSNQVLASAYGTQGTSHRLHLRRRMLHRWPDQEDINMVQCDWLKAWKEAVLWVKFHLTISNSPHHKQRCPPFCFMHKKIAITGEQLKHVWTGLRPVTCIRLQLPWALLLFRCQCSRW